ncbi:QsdR family transcriptional regulator [Williamsia sterculiae]|uniref:Transcriptional regulator, TetR family n=1 Tax=Williamsia sterculiae TaxID=1344003 RepID=A0A1N7DG14_9NOCA|nr:QsdR family transcriptional regulator [Williamsia sterculiae]SIR74707.1 transcriptional regulator, TetR family [Williamsia sterculiae]
MSLSNPRAQALDAATELYLAGRPLDMSALADRLGVGRATLYRHVGNREDLLAAVLATATEQTYRHAVRHARGTGVDRVLSVQEAMMRAVDRSRPLRVLTAREPLLFIRLALLPGAIQSTASRVCAEMLRDEQARSGLQLPMDPEPLAGAIVRISDVHLYAPLLGGDHAEIETALDLVAVLLGARR